jgi:hypothetical protein
MNDPEIPLIFAAYLLLKSCSNRYGFINQARSAIKYALLHRGYRPEEDDKGCVRLVPDPVPEKPKESGSGQ